ncbi:unnamed protein product [Coffea canephora]|uniref:Bifunctional inhibitor/plant lipid transfer protein/seed storage helical domain-containing protein n=1 Tax=Coffea canephora TaxID=49390 RepID=A0A068U2I6_COFCA|nr:unnamed protein product [Coffea canephora]
MKMKFRHAVAAWLVMLVVAVGEVQVSRAVTCSIAELSPCLSAINGPNPPSAPCCAKLKEQRPCFCGYIQNPTYAQYVNSPKAKGIAKACQVSIPNC